jgi:hypothetical protein
MKITMKSVGLVALILLAGGHAQAATVNPFTDLGSAGPSNYAILALGYCNSGVTACDTASGANKTNVIMTNGAYVFGKVGVSPNNAQTVDGGNLTGDNTSSIHGIADVGTNGVVSGFGAGNSMISGGVTQSGAENSVLTALSNSATSAIVKAYTDAQAQCTGGINQIGPGCNKSTTTSINSTNGGNISFAGTVSGDINIVDLTGGLQISGNTDLILSGNASTYYVIDISGGQAFTVLNGADITLSGGISSSNVLFNVVGSTGGAVCFSSIGSCTNTVTGKISNTANVSGTILAPIRDINLDGAVVNGEVISGNLNITVDDAEVIPEPGTLLAFATGLAALGTRLRRLRRK